MDFQLPPRILNENGEKRRVGFELEFGGMTLDSAAQILLLLFGGQLHRKTDFVYTLDSSIGEFTVEADSTFLKDKKYSKYLEMIGLDPKNWDETFGMLAGTLIPFEIVMPPLPVDKLAAVERIRRELYTHSATGTKSAIFTAFGMQFNPEVPDKKPETLHSYMRAFFLLYDWLYEESDIPIARKVAPFIHDFPEEYVALVLDPDYDPSLAGFMHDYLKHNPTRNRPLDLLPLFAEIDKDLTFSYPVERELVKARPTFHYRLPNSNVDDPNWTIAADWNKWVEIERLAADPERLREIGRDYFLTRKESLVFTRAKWVQKTRDWLHVTA